MALVALALGACGRGSTADPTPSRSWASSPSASALLSQAPHQDGAPSPSAGAPEPPAASGSASASARASASASASASAPIEFPKDAPSP